MGSKENRRTKAMKGFMFVLAGITFILVLCGFTGAFHAGADGAIVQFFNPNTGCIVGSVFFAIGLLWPKRFIKK
jgi:hypothetical protein